MNNMKVQSMVPKVDGFYRLSSHLSGIEVAEQIKVIIENNPDEKLLKFKVSGTEGHADIIGMYLLQEYNIDVDIDVYKRIREILLIYKAPIEETE